MSSYNKLSDLHDTNSIPSPPSIPVADLLTHDRIQRAMSDTILSSTDRRFMGNCYIIHSRAVYSNLDHLDDTMPLAPIHTPSCSSPVSPGPGYSINDMDDYFLYDDTATSNNANGNTVLIYKEPSHHDTRHDSNHAIDTFSNDINGRYDTWITFITENEDVHIEL